MIDLRKKKDSAYAAGIELPIELRQRRNALEDASAPLSEKAQKSTYPAEAAVVRIT